MNIFLDTNVLYKDPFLTKGKNPILLSLANHGDVKLFINKTVYDELLRAHRRFLDQEIKNISEALDKINPFLEKIDHKIDIDLKAEGLKSDLISHFSKLQNENLIEIIKYDSEILERIVEIDMYEKAPFIKKRQIVNRREEKVEFIKKEIRDAIIWYSYELFIEKNNLKECFFISNNTKEFGDEGAGKIGINEPYPLHPEIREASNLVAYKNVSSFLNHNKEKVNNIFSDLQAKILFEELSYKIEEELSGEFAKELIDKYFSGDIMNQNKYFIADFEPEDVHKEYSGPGHVTPADGGIVNVELKEVELYGNEFTVTMNIIVEMHVEIHLFNSASKAKEIHNKYEYQGTDILEVEESITFILPVEIKKDMKKEDFCLRSYIEKIETSHVDIEYIDWKNISHSNRESDEID
ncbi:PIN domain-containing protein [Priestia megaterium]